MSTFKGVVTEFPQIRIDYFRHQPGQKPPLACFLSHVHSDHLTGLESLRAPFVYCSAATREILLRLEKYHYRVNFAKEILESRNVTYDRTMRRLAKPLPLDTPTVIELTPEQKIQVTLFDANHCVGAVMFLIEGDGKAVLYTGDIRAETWWVNSLVQNPVLIPYTLGSRRLDCIYLDTTFATKSEPYREFPSKAEGIRELLEQVGKYPEDTVFYFHSWTFGYENVWIALSSFLQSQVHLDSYRYRLYGSLSTLKNDELYESRRGFDIREASSLCGFRNGNHVQSGILTRQSHVRIHSCERGMGCPVMDQDADAQVVHIIPIITRANGTEIVEIGAGGGKGDLDQKEELDTGGMADMSKLMDLCASKIEDETISSKVMALLQHASNHGKGIIELEGELQQESQNSQEELSLQTLVSILSSHAKKASIKQEKQNRTIRFPYSRHSSYSELCLLVEVFKPMDVFPCTVDEKNWNPSLGMRPLFGQYCSANTFRHDEEMMALCEGAANRDMIREKTQEPDDSQTIDEVLTPKRGVHNRGTENTVVDPEVSNVFPSPVLIESVITADQAFPAVRTDCEPATRQLLFSNSRNIVEISDLNTQLSLIPLTPFTKQTRDTANLKTCTLTHTVNLSTTSLGAPSIAPKSTLQSPAPKAPPSHSNRRHPNSSLKRKRRTRLTNREIAYKCAAGLDGYTWSDYGGLVSAKRKEDMEEVEL
ncbi:beta-lactamase-like protein [Dendryphion nanum]|uniref:Protein artemis n=1 Tax=Dendryphion nanum TaxID=256645 RepID=A0A9P9EKR3_9PLEO|nr:beta-lactamase-like protein [Dendryphion nanum]